MNKPASAAPGEKREDELYNDALAHALANNILRCNRDNFVREVAMRALEINAGLLKKAKAGEVITDDPQLVRKLERARAHIEGLLA